MAKSNNPGNFANDKTKAQAAGHKGGKMSSATKNGATRAGNTGKIDDTK